MEGIAPGQEPDAAHIAALIAIIKARHVHAVFIEGQASSAVTASVGQAGGARLGGQLFSDSLAAPPHQAATYLGMFLANTRTIVAGLGMNRGVRLLPAGCRGLLSASWARLA